MLVNPELRRNAWLDFSWHKLFITPATILLIVYIKHLSGNESAGAEMAFMLACFFIFIWGTKKASETVVDEINNGTWDFQRQSSIHPWSMTWGKLVGSTLYTWYGSLIALSLYCLLNTHGTLVRDLLIITTGGLFAQGLTLLLSMQNLALIRRERNNKTFRYFMLGAVVGGIVTSYGFGIYRVNISIEWYQYTFNLSHFYISSLFIFLLWVVLGLYRSFCRELQYQHIPWVWAAFNIFCVVYFPGLVHPYDLGPGWTANIDIDSINKLLMLGPWYVAFLVSYLITYIALFGDELTTVRYKRWITCAKEKNNIESFQHLPWWTISIVITVIVGFLVIGKQLDITKLPESFSPNVLVLTSILFLFRDILLIHYFNFKDNPKRALSTSIFYLFVLYFLLPFLFGALSLGNLVPIFIPSWGQNTALALISSGAQIAILAMLCFRRWQQAWKEE